jgi:hypothetical protein
MRIGGVSAGIRVSSDSIAWVPLLEAHRNLARAQRQDALLELLGHLADRIGPAGLGDHVHGAGLQRLDGGRGSRLGHRADDDDRQRVVLHQLAQEGQAVHARHLDVERQHVGPVLDDHVAGDEGIGRPADHFDRRLAAQRVADHLAHDRRVVDDEDARPPRRASHG